MHHALPVHGVMALISTGTLFLCCKPNVVELQLERLCRRAVSGTVRAHASMSPDRPIVQVSNACPHVTGIVGREGYTRFQRQDALRGAA